MKKVETIHLDQAKSRLRRSSSSRLLNSGGFAVLEEADGKQFYVAGSDGNFIRFCELRGLSHGRQRVSGNISPSRTQPQ